MTSDGEIEDEDCYYYHYEPGALSSPLANAASPLSQRRLWPFFPTNGAAVAVYRRLAEGMAGSHQVEG